MNRKTPNKLGWSNVKINIPKFEKIGFMTAYIP